jgi:hypothetical protein
MEDASHACGRGIALTRRSQSVIRHEQCAQSEMVIREIFLLLGWLLSRNAWLLSKIEVLADVAFPKGDFGQYGLRVRQQTRDFGCDHLSSRIGIESVDNSVKKRLERR